MFFVLTKVVVKSLFHCSKPLAKATGEPFLVNGVPFFASGSPFWQKGTPFCVFGSPF
jgi:hypothetical protein